LKDNSIDKYSRSRYEASFEKSERPDHLDQPDEDVDDEDLVGEEKQPRKKLKIALIASGCVLLALAIGIAVYVAAFMSKVSDDISLSDKVKIELAEVLVEPEHSDASFYMLIIGSDSSDP